MFKPWRLIPASAAHELAPLALGLYAHLCPARTPEWRPFSWRGISFPNRLGIASGLDKNAEFLSVWQRLGAGFVEIGTITPSPQNSNPGKIFDRDWELQCLWNKMGFPSEGAREVSINLENRDASFSLPLLINIGKNRNTPPDQAAQDYAEAAKRLAHHAQALVINVSSPNTTGLRDLQSRNSLQKIVESVCLVASQKPVLVKLSPDLSTENLSLSIEASLAGGASGFILTNTTYFRPPHCQFPKEGGLSGQGLAELSKQSLKETLRHLGAKRSGLLIISVGGVLSPEQVQERLDLGADLVQTYSALVFRGPSFFKQTGAFFASKITP